MFICILIKRDDELLMIKELCSDGKTYWCLPSYLIKSQEDYDNIPEYIKHEFEVDIELGDLYDSFEWEENKYQVVTSNLLSYISPEKGDAKWVNARELSNIPLKKGYENSFKKIILEYEQLFFISDIIKRAIESVVKESGVDDIAGINRLQMEIRQACDGIKVFIPNEFGNYCPYVFCVDFSIKSAETVDLFMYWSIPRIFAQGDKSDFYVLFSNIMSIILRCFFNQSVLVDYISLISPVEFNSAKIIFNNEITEVKNEKLKEKIEYFFNLYLTSMFIFEQIVGSLSLKRETQDVYNKYIDFFDIDEYFNYVIGEEHEYYANFNLGIFLIRMKNDVYDEKRLLSRHQWEFVDGIDGKILYQLDKDKASYNYVSYEDWNIISNLIETMDINNYSLVCQENHIYILEDTNIWIFNGNFSEFWAAEEKEKILDRQSRENAILDFNRKYQWSFPVDSGRFEELIADLLETDVFTQDVRLVGKSNNADGGRDLLIYKRCSDGSDVYTTNLVIGQCKAYKKTVNKSHVQDIRDTIEYYDGHGFFLAVTSTISAPLIDHLCKLKNTWDVDWWTEREIFKRLRHYPRIAKMYSDIVK